MKPEDKMDEWVDEYRSTVIARFRWKGQHKRDSAPLIVSFYAYGDKELKTYRYDDVSYDIFTDLIEQASKKPGQAAPGKVVNSRVKGEHDVDHLGTHDADERPDTIVPNSSSTAE